MRTPHNPERERVLEQSVLEGWTLQATGERLGVTRERVRQLLKKRGWDKLRTRWNRGLVKERPVRWCQECGAVIQNNRTVYCSGPCAATRERRYNAAKNKARYHTDPAYREYNARYKRDHPEAARAAQKRYRVTIGGALAAAKRRAHPIDNTPLPLLQSL